MSAEAAFIDALEAERQATARFVDLLRREQQALSGGMVDDVEAITPHKAKMADQLAQYAGVRRTRLLAMGIAPDAQGMRTWAASQPEPGRAGGIWESLHALAGQARALNETNGLLIEMRLQHCERSLMALNDACGNTTLYGRHGHTISSPGSGTSLRA